MEAKKTIYNISKNTGFSTQIVRRIMQGENNEIMKNLFEYGRATIPDLCTLTIKEKKILKNGMLVPNGFEIVAKPLAKFEQNFNTFAMSMIKE